MSGPEKSYIEHERERQFFLHDEDVVRTDFPPWWKRAFFYFRTPFYHLFSFQTLYWIIFICAGILFANMIFTSVERYSQEEIRYKLDTITASGDPTSDISQTPSAQLMQEIRDVPKNVWDRMFNTINGHSVMDLDTQ